MNLLAPSILSANFTNIAQEIKSVTDAGADLLHLDVMDGHFVPNITFGPKMVKDLRSLTMMPLDVHLMISEPEKYIDAFADAGADWISVHYEVKTDLKDLLNQIKAKGCKAGAVINPATKVDVLEDILNDADYILIMSVNPGFGGQKFIEGSIEKAANLKKMLNGSPALIEMDGGIDLTNIKQIRDAGVNVFVCGNSIFKAKDRKAAISEMKKLIAE